MPDVDKLFLAELTRRGLSATPDDEGGYKVEQGDVTVSISLANLRKDITRDGDLGRVERFADAVVAALGGAKTPPWEDAKPWVRWQLEPADSPLDGVLHDRISDQVVLVLVLASPDEAQIRWVADRMATEWGKTKDELFVAAGDNMAAIAEQAEITFEAIDGHKLGMIGTDRTAYKAALLFSRGLRPKAEPVLGWPLFAVMPCRDFVYLVPARDKELLPRMGAVVVKEYKQGAYPLSTEVFELTEEGIRATFEFQKPPTGDADAPDDPAWRVVPYGGFLRFRVPVQWTDEAIQRGTEYFDPKGAGRLMVLVLGKQSDEPVTHADGRTEAESLASGRGTVTPRDAATWLVEIPESTTDDLTMWGWMLVAAVPPNQVHIASFKYYVPTAVQQAEPERVEAEHAMVRQEVITAFFQPIPIPDSPAPEKPKHKPAPAAKPKRDKGDKN